MHMVCNSSCSGERISEPLALIQGIKSVEVGGAYSITRSCHCHLWLWFLNFNPCPRISAIHFQEQLLNKSTRSPFPHLCPNLGLSRKTARDWQDVAANKIRAPCATRQLAGSSGSRNLSTGALGDVQDTSVELNLLAGGHSKWTSDTYRERERER